MKTIRAILFDMDGTLVDSERVGQKAWAATADEMGIEIPVFIRQSSTRRFAVPK